MEQQNGLEGTLEGLSHSTFSAKGSIVTHKDRLPRIPPNLALIASMDRESSDGQPIPVLHHSKPLLIQLCYMQSCKGNKE